MSLVARLTVDLGAIVRNWRALDRLSAADCETAAVVKADAYGCGASVVAPALARAGVRTFFVALPSEGAVVREAVGGDPVIYVLGGFSADQAELYTAFDLRPILNSAEQARLWSAIAGPAGVQIDTGMNRLGMEADEFASLGDLPRWIGLIISHMGNADEPAHPLNAEQLQTFRAMTAGSGRPLSLSATAGLLLGAPWHFDMTRMGIGLYGGWPFEAAEPVVTVEAPVIQIRDVAPGETVGYGAAWVASRQSRIATISAGYADGLLRALSNGADAFLDGRRVPLAGRVSMDLITLDVTDHDCMPGDRVELLGPNQPIDRVAAAAGTIGHEVLTAIGNRYERTYVGGDAR